MCPHAWDIDPRTGRDMRPRGESALRLVVYTGRIRGLRTFSSGRRIGGSERANHSAHARILAGSPLQAQSPQHPSDLLQRDELDDYLDYLNRHPGRRVDVALTPSQEGGQVYLDFLVAEERPWRVYAQSTNTGTDETGENRTRIGFVHNQLTGRDDILRLDFVTGNFGDEFEAWIGAYSSPLWGFDRTRWFVEGVSSEFDASVVGFDDLPFEGHPLRFGLGQWMPWDARRCLVVRPMDLRIHFALNCGAASCPPIRFYKRPQ